MNQQTSKQKVKILVEKYESILSSRRSKKYSEEDVKKGFILPLPAVKYDIPFTLEGSKLVQPVANFRIVMLLSIHA